MFLEETVKWRKEFVSCTRKYRDEAVVGGVKK